MLIEVASVIELSEASGRVAAGLFMYQIYPPTIDTLVTGMVVLGILWCQYSAAGPFRAR